MFRIQSTTSAVLVVYISGCGYWSNDIIFNHIREPRDYELFINDILNEEIVDEVIKLYSILINMLC